MIFLLVIYLNIKNKTKKKIELNAILSYVFIEY